MDGSIILEKMIDCIAVDLLQLFKNIDSNVDKIIVGISSASFVGKKTSFCRKSQECEIFSLANNCHFHFWN